MNTNQDLFTEALIELNAPWLATTDNDYDLIQWKPNMPIPTKEQVDAKILELTNLLPMKLLREERDQKLNDTDKYLTSDFVYPNGVTKQDWLTYRQALRDLPSTVSPQLDTNGDLTNVTWPIPPS